MKKFFFRISLLLVILAVFIYYIMRNMGAIERTVNVTLSQSLGFILVAFGLAAAGYYFMVQMNKQVFTMMGIKRTMLEMALLQATSLTVNTLVPSSGLSVAILFAGDAREREESEAAAVTAVMLALLVDYISIAALIAFAILYLSSMGHLGLEVSIPTAIFFALTTGLYLLIYTAGRNKIALTRFLEWAKRIANKLLALFNKKIDKDETTVDRFVNELRNASTAISRDRTDFVKAIGSIFLSHISYMVAIYVLFISLGITPLYRVLITGYAIGMIFVVISPTPNGVGFVEGSMTLAYTSMGIPGATAAAVTLIHRGFSFWMPLFIGFVALQRKHILNLFDRNKK